MAIRKIHRQDTITGAPQDDQLARMSDKEFVLEVVRALEESFRFGVLPDEPEGRAYIQWSDTLARVVAGRLYLIAEGMI